MFFWRLLTADYLGRTAGDIALSLNDEKSYMLIRNEGIRQGKLSFGSMLYNRTSLLILTSDLLLSW